MAGLFITLEGIDGTGKTTQAGLLVEALRRAGLGVLHTREPGGTPLGRQLRELLLVADTVAIAPQTEMLLMAADRAQHVAEVIRPALLAGTIVVSERYVDSSLAYQSAAGVALEAIRAANAIATGGLDPDLTFLFDADPAHVFRQTRTDRIESRTLNYHRRVREAFRTIQSAAPQRVVLVPVAGQTPADIHASVMETVRLRLGVAQTP